MKKLYCWFIAVSMVGEIWLGWYMVGLSFYDRWYHDSLTIHKSIGMIILFPALAKVSITLLKKSSRKLSHLFSFKPLLYGPRHIILYLLISMICISGYTISTSQGAGISIFDWINIPALYPINKWVRNFATECHYYLAYGAAIFIIGHALMGQKHRLKP